MEGQLVKGFDAVKHAVLTALHAGDFQHEPREEADYKNLLSAGKVSAEDVARVIRRCKGTDHQCSPHHSVKGVDCHIIKSQGWYVKFYFVDPVTMFISVHPLEL